MKYQIFNRWTGQIQFEADLESDDGLSVGQLRGLAIKWARRNDADLRGADLRSIKHDLWGVLLSNSPEVPAFLVKLRSGEIDGSTYTGECACLVGTIANIKHCEHSLLKPNSSSAAERWFLGISKGDTPERSPIAKITEEWIVEFLALTGRMVAA